MSIETRIQAINDHLIDDYKVLRLAGADLTGVNKNIVNLKMSWKERLLYFMNNGTDEVWNNWDKVTGSGTTLSINGTVQAPMSLVYKGNTYQSGTPTPSSPIPVQVVSGDNSINVVGKNLVKSKNVSSYLTQFGTALQIEADLQPSTTYTISFYGTDGNSLYLNERLFTYSSLNIGTERASIQATTKSTISKSDASQYTEGYGWIIFKNNRNQSSANVFDDLQVELGNQATAYEPYKGATYPINLGDIELCKIGTYQDKIFKNTPNTTDYDSNLEDNVWYLKKEIGKVDLGTLTWISENEYNTGQFRTSGNSLQNIPLFGGGCICNKFIWLSGYIGSTVSNGKTAITNSQALPLIRATWEDYSSYSGNDFQTAMSGNLLYYQMFTPTYETITDTTLLSQLEAMKQSYDSQTNISQTNNDLPFELSVTALEVMS